MGASTREQVRHRLYALAAADGIPRNDVSTLLAERVQLRDSFAKAAMSGLLAAGHPANLGQALTQSAYEIADQMLITRIQK